MHFSTLALEQFSSFSMDFLNHSISRLSTWKKQSTSIFNARIKVTAAETLDNLDTVKCFMEISR